MPRTIKAKAAGILSSAIVAATLLLAGPASAHHDPNPPYAAAAYPGSVPLFGYHHERLASFSGGRYIDCFGGIQSEPARFRIWSRCQATGGGDLNVTYYNIHLQELYSSGGLAHEWKAPGPRSATQIRTISTHYWVGAWHPMTQDGHGYRMSFEVDASIVGVGGFSDNRRGCSYRWRPGSSYVAPLC